MKAKLTPVTACLISLCGPYILWLLYLVSAILIRKWNTASNILMIVFGVVLLLAAIWIRVYYAEWYVKKKGRAPQWGLLSLLGFWGWVMLWFLSDQSKEANIGPTSKPHESLNTRANQSGTPIPHLSPIPFAKCMYYVSISDKTVGPIDIEALKELWKAQKINEKTMCCEEISGVWKKMSERSEYAYVSES